MPKTNSALEILQGLGYDPVDIESDADYIRALKESYNELQIKNASDSRLEPLANAIKGYRKSKREQPKLSADKVKEQIDAKEKKKKDAMNFISPGSAPLALPPAEDAGGGDMSSTLMKISNDVNIIKGIVEAQKDISEDQADDTRKAREKKKRSMAENLMEGSKEGFKKVKGAVGKLLKPAEGIFSSIFKFLSLFLLGTGLMKLLDWMGNPENASKLDSIFRFLKDFWPVIAAGVIALMGPIPGFVAAVALAFGFVPKIIDFVKSIFGLNKDVDKEIKNQEKASGIETGDTTTITTTTIGPTTAFAEDAQGNEITDLDERKRISDEAREAIPMMNKGGEVPGQGNTDTVPAMLTPGEFVLTKDAVKNIGADTLYGLNAAAGGVGKPSEQKRAQKKKKKMKTSTVGTMMNMGGLKMGGMTNNMSYGGGGVVNNMSYAGGGKVPVQNYFMGGLVDKVGGLIARTPQARLIKLAANQIKKSGVTPPVSKALKALKAIGMKNTPPSPMAPEGGDTSVNEIPRFSVTASGGRAKEQTLGIRR